MMSKLKRLLIFGLCILSLSLFLTFIVHTPYNEVSEMHIAIPVQGVFSNTINPNDPLYEQKKVQLSLLHTGNYYIMALDGTVSEAGQYSIDENGFGHLYGGEDNSTSLSQLGYFIRLDNIHFLLISRAGEIVYMQQIDNGGRITTSEVLQ